jgi:protein-tyrosine-phosphatase
MAEGLLRHRLAGVADDVHVHSAGLLDLGRPATPDGVKVMAGHGIDISAHQSRQVTADLIKDADLVIGMSRRHVAETAVLVPDAWTRAFTLKELVRRGDEAGPRRRGQPLDEWLADVHWGRKRSELVGRSRDDDIADPVGQPRSAYERTAKELDQLLERVVTLIWGKQ